MAELSAPAAYRVLLASRLRSQLAYRASFALDVVNAFGIGLLEFAEIYLVLRNVPTLGGLDLLQAGLVFALANLGFALGDLVLGQLDTVPDLIRMGRLEALLVRPMPLIAQLVTSDFQLRRVGRALAGLAVLVVVMTRLDLVWTPAQVYLVVATPLFGAAIFGGLFVLAGGLQFFLVDGAEFTSGFLYGGSYAAQIPGAVLLTPLRLLFTFLIPATVVAYLPSLLILGLAGPPYLPSWLGWCAPVFALWTWLLAMLAWRAGLARFTGAGG